MSDYQLYVQRVEFLAAAPGESQSGERTVILTIRPDRNSFRPHNIAISRAQAIRLFKSLRTVLRQSAGAVLVGLAVASAGGCATEVHVVTEQIGTRNSAAENAERRTETAVAVRLLDEAKPSPVEDPGPVEAVAAAPPLKPKKAVEVVGNGNSVTVIRGDLHVHQHRHIHFYEAPDHMDIDIRRYDAERNERCERSRREYEEKVARLRRMFYEPSRR